MAGPRRAPDYYLKTLHKKTGRKGRIGAAWDNVSGSISIVLDPFVVIDWQHRDDVVLTLFPNDRGED